MFSKKTYIATLVVCVALATIAKLIRSEVDTIWLSAVLGSAPSYFYLLGMSVAPAILMKNITYRGLLKILIGITLGALAYELEQNWTSRTFDSGDLIATLFAFLTVVLSHWTGSIFRLFDPELS